MQGARNQLLLGKSVVFDDNCLHLHQRDELRAVAEKSDAKSVLIYLDIPDKVLKERKEKNKITKERHDVPSAWLKEDEKVFERPTATERPIIYTPDTDLEGWFKKIDEIF